MADEIVADALSQLNRVTAGMQAKEQKKQEDKDPVLWVSGGGYQPRGDLPAGIAGGKQMARLSQLQQEVLAAGAMRTPEYKYLEDSLIRAGFMSKRYAGVPEYAAGALEFAAKLYGAYAVKNKDKSFTEWFDWYSSSAPFEEETGGGRGGYRGPTASVTFANEGDLRRAADALGADLLGRAVTDEEFQRALKKVRAAEQAEPTVSDSSPGMSVTKSGLSAEGRGDIMRDIIAKGPEAEEFTKATKVVDWFNQWLERRAG